MVEETTMEEFVPTPLVIENKKKNDINSGVYKISITIEGEDIQETGYEGTALVLFDGEIMRITTNDAIRSRFNDLF